MVRAIGTAWERENVEAIVDVRYVVAAQDRVVDEESARKSWGNDQVDVVVDRGHVDVVKPVDATDLSYLILKNHILRSTRAATRSVDGIRDASSPRGAPAACGSEEIRVACSAVLRIERHGQYLLVQNMHRPESVAPFGGVYKYLEHARDRLDSLSFRGQAIDDDMQNDVRGYIPRESFEAFRAWFLSGVDRESASDCLARELREEVQEVGLEATIVPQQLRFRHVRSVPEGPEHVATIGCDQYRVFDVYEIVEDSVESKAFVEALASHVTRCDKLVWADGESVRRGRAGKLRIIGAHASYLFGTRRFRDVDPPFATG